MTPSANQNPPRRPSDIAPRRFYSLDALRGVAALEVVVYHWQLFFRDLRAAGKPGADYLPLWGLLNPVYDEGRRAVDLFFSLSGFIFFWLYAEEIKSRRVGGREFAALRFSRLYPLHLATLLLVALQFHFLAGRAGPLFEKQFNDGRHFVLQLFMASSWGFERGFSFNGPIWSVSVEVLLYIVFYFLCLAGWVRWWQLIPLAGVGFLLLKHGVENLGRGLFSFFLGGLAFHAFVAIRKRGAPAVWRGTPAVFLVALWVCIPLNAHYQAAYEAYRRLGGPAHLSVAGKDLLGAGILEFTTISQELLLFPLTILALALWETSAGSLGKWFSLLGDISYSSYLLHYPLQIFVFATALGLGFDRSLFSSPWILLLFMGGLVAIAWLSYEFFERPAQSWIRRRICPARPPTK